MLFIVVLVKVIVVLVKEVVEVAFITFFIRTSRSRMDLLMPELLMLEILDALWSISQGRGAMLESKATRSS